MSFKKNSLRKYSFLFIIFGFFILVLFLPKISSAIITGLGCERASTVKYKTECKDEKTIGHCSGGHCCSEHEVCEETCDEDGNCTETCHDVCDSTCWECSCSGSWDEYKSTCNTASSCSCNTDVGCCDKDILWRHCYSQQGDDDCHMGSCENEECCVKCDPPDTCEECGSWQKPARAGCEGDCTKWGTTKPECKCCGECLEAPQNPRYCMSPSCSVTASAGNVYLPVKLDWDDVPGWWEGWSNGGGGGSNIQEYAECQRGYIDFCWAEAISAFEEWKKTHPDWKFCQGEWTDEYLVCLRRETKNNCEDHLTQGDTCTSTCPALGGEESECYNSGEFVKSYKITITGDLRSCDDGSDINSKTFVLGASEFFAPCPCFFKSNRTYTWTVKACCDEGGTNCQEDPAKQLHASFTTSLSPEPISPEDPDWAGPGRAEPFWDNSKPYPVELSWCEVEEAESYVIQAYKEGVKYCPEILGAHHPQNLILSHPEGLLSKSIYFDLDSFTKETNYDWEIATCFDEYGLNCSGFGQKWSFFGSTELAKVELKSPENGGCANFHSQLEWFHIAGARSYRYTIIEVPSLQNRFATGSVPFKDIWNHLELNTTYSWKVKGCWDDGGTECEASSTSDIWNFTITGAVPTGLDVAEKDPATGNALIPIKLNWDDVPCAASYQYKLNDEVGDTIVEGVTGSSNLSVEYGSGTKTLKQGTNYSFVVSTCAKYSGEECNGQASLNFQTFELKAPENPYPSDGGEFYTNEYYLKWDSVLGGAFYWYEVNDAAGTTIASGIVQKNNVFIDTSTMELGDYTWQVKACLDANCDEFGPTSTWSFELVEAKDSGAGGLVPCGRYTDNPDTPWNERERCGVNHFFIMIYLIINYLLWKVIPIVLLLLALASGVIFYFSGQLGIPDPISQVKSLWKAVGLGLAVIFLAWTGISLILGLFGYQVGLLGDWWRIEF